MKTISKYSRLFMCLLQMRLAKQATSGISFIGPFLVDGIMFGIQILTFFAIYSNITSIGGWQKGEIILFIGSFSLINALNMTLYFFGVISIPDKIKSGKLDYYLTKPVNSLFYISFESINLGSGLLIVLSFAILLYGVKILNKPISMVQVGVYAYVIILMTILFYDIMLLFRTIAFYLIEADGLLRVEEECIGLCMQIPGVLFQRVFKIVFYFILPYGIMGTIPAQVLAGTVKRNNLILATLITILFTMVAICFWNYSRRKYNSASS